MSKSFIMDDEDKHAQAKIMHRIFKAIVSYEETPHPDIRWKSLGYVIANEKQEETV